MFANVMMGWQLELLYKKKKEILFGSAISCISREKLFFFFFL